MAIRLLGHLPSTLHADYRRALEAVNGLSVGEQLEVACQLLVDILVAARLRAVDSQADRGDYNLLCDAVEEWLEDKVAVLRLTQPN